MINDKKNTPCTTPAASTLQQPSKIPVRVLLGPTASGKSAYALELAQKYGCEIVSCDSRQIYKKMTIGTAKPSPGDLEKIAHWFIDILDPGEEYAAYRFGREAQALIRERAKQGKQVIVCGGTGFYVKALIHGANEAAASDPHIRAELMAIAATAEGALTLHEELCTVDPVSGKKIHTNDVQRVVRALAVFRQTGKPFSAQHAAIEVPEDFEFRIAKLELPRDVLYKNINARVDAMVNNGLYEEFERLLSDGYTAASPGLQTVGYRELFAVANGSVTFSQAIEQIKQHTRNFAKRQITWFTTQVDGVTVDAAKGTSSALEEIYRF